MRLGVMVSYRIARDPAGSLTASEKFLSEMRAYADRWPGPVDVYVAWTDASDEVLGSAPLPDPTRNLTFHPVAPERFGLDMITVLPDAIFTAVDAPLHRIPRQCRSLPVATVVGVEYTLRTRLQMIMAERPDVLRRLGGLKWNLEQEARIIRAVRQADGLQANGGPALERYGRYARNAMGYLDSRARSAVIPSEDHVIARSASLDAGRPLRLAFTGRLEARKGPLETVTLASELRRRGVDFTFLVAGDGPQRSELAKAVAGAGLGAHFELPGVLDFDNELMPRLRDEVDLFFCPHPQGDPSCTYVETLANGVPIVGYDNEAVRSLAARTTAVVPVPMNDVAAAAATIVALGRGPEALAQRSTEALAFARQHSFERVYDERVEHLLAVAKG